MLVGDDSRAGPFGRWPRGFSEGARARPPAFRAPQRLLLAGAVLRLPTVWIPPTACDGTIVTAIEVRPAPPSFGAAVRRTLRFRRRV